MIRNNKVKINGGCCAGGITIQTLTKFKGLIKNKINLTRV